MDCKQVENIILEAASLESFEPDEPTKKHLESCSSCKLFYEAALKIENYAASLGKVDGGDDFYLTVMEKIEREKTSSAPRFSLRFYRNVAASALLALALGAGILAGKYTAKVYSESNLAINKEVSGYLQIDLADNDFDLVNFDE